MTARGSSRYAAPLDTDERQLQVLKLSQAVDDTAWATARTGALGYQRLDRQHHRGGYGTAFPGVPHLRYTGGANNAPAQPGPTILVASISTPEWCHQCRQPVTASNRAASSSWVPAGLATTANNRSSAPTRHSETSLRPDRVLLRGACFQLLSPPRHLPRACKVRALAIKRLSHTLSRSGRLAA